jgi:beta-glucanase (GH16 family)
LATLSFLTLALYGLTTAAQVQTKPEGAGAPSPTAVAPTAPLPDYTLVWGDEFNSDSLDQSKWGFRTDSKHLSTQKPENVSVKNGKMCLTLKKETVGGKQYTGGGVVSKAAFKYGYYEARLKVTPVAGWHSAFWLMKHDGSGSTDSHEAVQGLDVFQNNSINPLAYVVCVRKYNPEPPEVFGFSTLAAPDLSADFHTVGCEFAPQAVKFFLDGEVVETVDATRFPHGEQNIWLSSIASHMGGAKAVDDARLPAVVECDYVRYFRKSGASGTTP